jgi:uncharacterized membrane protein YphA (DoxX/SURF4 family)
MTKKNKIIYWVITGFLAFGMLAQGFSQLFHAQAFVDMFNHLGYPLYFLDIIGIWKILGAAVILLPGFRLVKEWAYAGFFLVMSGAVFSHIALGDSIQDTLPAAVLVVLIVLSWYLRPADRRIILANQ